MPCPAFTYSSDDRQSCRVYEQITDSTGKRYQPYILNKIEKFCSIEEFSHLCDHTPDTLGPIKLDENSHDTNQPIFFFTDKKPLQTDRYDFHKSRFSDVGENSFVYMLYTSPKIELSQIEEFMEVETDEQSSLYKLSMSLFNDFTKTGEDETKIGSGIMSLVS